MKYNPSILRSAQQEWSDWLAVPDAYPKFTIADMRQWAEDRPPLHAFSCLAEAIELMQDEIDLLHMKLAEAKEM